MGLVNGRFKLESICFDVRFNESLKNKIQILSTEYEGFRKIRGDGNWYFFNNL